MSPNIFSCPRCRSNVGAGSQFCSACGLPFAQVPPGIVKKKGSLIGLWIALGIIGLCGFCGLIGAISDLKKQQTRETVNLSSTFNESNVQLTPSPIATPTFVELKEKAKPLIALERTQYDSYELNEFDNLIGPLRQIPKEAREYREAQLLVKKLIDKSAIIGAERIVLGEKPKNSTWDGNVKPAQDYLRQVLNDYRSSEYLGWTPVEKVYQGKEPYWRTTVRLRAKNAFGAYIVKDITFFIRNNQVVKVNGL